MENASKALIIAGEVLIALIVISIGVYIFTTYQEGTEPYMQAMNDNEIQAFNSKFLACIDNSECTIQDVITMINLALDTEGTSTPVMINFKGTNYGCTKEVISNKGTDLNLLLKANSGKIYKISNIEYQGDDDINPDAIMKIIIIE